MFISHSSRDNAIAAEVMAALHAHGIDHLFLDVDEATGLPPGARWERELYERIAAAHAVVLVVTPHWHESKWCFAEFTQARALGKPIFPIVVTPCGDRFVSPDIQQLDLLRDREGGLQRLASELTRLAVDAQGGFAWDVTRPPYPGLLVYEREDAAVYFGRDDDVRRLIERLNARRVQGGPRLVAVVGASGSGKSSLMRAGVLPRLERDATRWLPLPPFRPRSDPATELARALAEAGGTPQEWPSVRERLVGDDRRAEAARIVADLRTRAGAREAHVLVTVDQAEELFTVADDAARAAFVDALAALTAEPTPSLVALTIRSDRLDLLHGLADRLGPFEEFALRPMPPTRLREVIEGPARIAGLRVDDELVAAAIADATTTDALPLLAFTLRELFDRFAGNRMPGERRTLTLEHYRSLGDPPDVTPLENAIRKRADEVMQELRSQPEQTAALRELFVTALARVDDQGHYSRRPARWQRIGPIARPAVERLVSARLLVSDQDEAGKTVEVAHEALLRKWPTLKAWLDEQRDFMIGRLQLQRALADWQKATGATRTRALLQGLLLDRARDWLAHREQSLEDDEVAFIRASDAHAQAEEARRRRARRAIMAGLAVTAAVFAGLAYVATERERTARAARFAVEARSALTAGDVATAVRHALQADSIRSDENTRSILLQSTIAVSPFLEVDVPLAGGRGMPGDVSALAWTSDGLAVIGGGTGGAVGVAPLAGAGTTARPLPVQATHEPSKDRPEAVRAIATDAPGDVVAVLEDGRLVRTGRGGDELAVVAELGALKQASIGDGGRAVLGITEDDDRAALFRCPSESGRTAAQCTRRDLVADERATVAALDTRGTVAAVATALGVTIEPLGEGPTQASDLGPATMGEVLGLAWDAAGETLAVGTDTSRTRLRNRRGEARGEFDARTPRTHRLLWAPTAPLLAANCDDVAICVWTIPREADQPARLGAVLSAHREAVTALAWSPDSRRLASAATDGTLKVWAVQGDRGRTILRSPDPAPLADLDVSSDGQWLAASDDAGRIVVWSTKSGAVAAVLRIDEERATTSIRWHPTQPLLAVADVSGTITLFDWPDGRRRTSPKRDERMVGAIRWLPDERALVAATQDGAAVRWDIDASDDRALSELPGRHDEAALVLAVSPAAHGGTPTLLSADTMGVVLSHTQPPATVLSMLAITGAKVSLDSLQFSPAGDRVLVAGNSGDVFVFDWPPGANPTPIRLATNAGMITSAAFSPDGRWVAAIDPGSQLHVWRTADWRPFASVLLRSEIGTTPQDPHGQVGQLRRLTWLGADEIAVATRAGSVQVVSVDLDAWKARVTDLYPVAD